MNVTQGADSGVVDGGGEGLRSTQRVSRRGRGLAFMILLGTLGFSASFLTPSHAWAGDKSGKGTQKNAAPATTQTSEEPSQSLFTKGSGSGLPAEADASKAAEPQVDEEARNNARKLLLLMGSDKLALQVMEQMLSQFKVLLPQVPPEFWREFMKEIDARELVEIQIPVYTKYLTPADIQELIRFYESPVGKRLTSVMPQITQESMEAGQKWGAIIGERIVKRLQEKGYKI